MDKQKWIEILEKEGLQNVRVVEIPPNANPGEHTHEHAEVHVVVKGEFTLTDQSGQKLFTTGERLDIPAGTTHSVIFGREGCTLVIGVKEA